MEKRKLTPGPWGVSASQFEQIKDLLVRWRRMQGRHAFWLPGTDHAGIATQAKVEARLRKQGISRYDLGREKFVQQVWDWKDEYADIIHKQWAKMGISVDYDRERFTLDEGCSRALILDGRQPSSLRRYLLDGEPLGTVVTA